MPFKIIWISYDKSWSVRGYHATKAEAEAHAVSIGGHADWGWQ